MKLSSPPAGPCHPFSPPSLKEAKTHLAARPQPKPIQNNLRQSTLIQRPQPENNVAVVLRFGASPGDEGGDDEPAGGVSGCCEELEEEAEGFLRGRLL